MKQAMALLACGVLLRPVLALPTAARGSQLRGPLAPRLRALRRLAASGAGEPSQKAPFYVTTPIYYVNDRPHIGHAYTTLACDVLARWKRQEGRQVRFLTGTDEHGQKVQQSAEQAGKTPQEYVDELSGTFRGLLDVMDFSNDQFIRTTDQDHKASVVQLWKLLEEKGHIYLGAYEGWYSVRDEAYYTESELVDGKAPTGADVEWVVKEPSYFFRLSEWEKPLLEFYEQNPDFIAPVSRRNEVVSFVKGGLKDLSISRTTFDWGIPVPVAEGTGDDSKAHVMYVWVDALANYISALGWPDQDSDSDFDTFWPHAVHLVGKDILRFHAVYWPALLMAAGLAPPKRLFAHGWWTRDGQKISKSIGNVINPTELVEQYGVNQVRYFLMSEVPFGQDGDYSDTAMLACANGFLANALGNLQMRVLSLVFKNCGKEVPTPFQEDQGLNEDDEALLTSAKELYGKMQEELDAQAMHKACDALNQVVRQANQYIDEQAPWALKKTDMTRMNIVLWTLMETLRHVAVCASPFMPGAGARMLDQLGVPQDGGHRTFEALQGTEPGVYFDTTFSIQPGTAVTKPDGIFPRIETEDNQGGTGGEGKAKKPPPKQPKSKAKGKGGHNGGDTAVKDTAVKTTVATQEAVVEPAM